MSYDKTKTFDKAEQELDKELNKKPKEMTYGSLFGRQKKEIMYFIMNDGSTINVTSEQKNSINGKVRVRIGDIKTVIHNHLEIPNFSKGDEDFYSHLLGKGFKGKFLLFCKNKIRGLDKPNGKHENDNQ